MQSVVAAGCVSLSVFEVRPAIFEIQRGEQETLEILFSPPRVETFSDQVTVVCDNCQIKHFTITGENHRSQLL